MSLQLLTLLTLSSSNLPIGAYCYSQGVESAIETGLITDEKSCCDFLVDACELLLVRYELPILAKLMDAKPEDIYPLIQQYMASRESKELLLETEQLAHAFYAWLRDVLFYKELNKETSHDTSNKKSVDELLFAHLPSFPKQTTAKQLGFLPLYALTCRYLQLPTADVLTSYGFTQLENQVLAAVKILPLGQMAGQRILLALHHELEQGVADVLANKILVSSSLPNFAILSSTHEMQYSRLFRS